MDKIILDSLKRLYHNTTLPSDKHDGVKLTVDKLIQSNKISQEEFNYITQF